MDRQRLLREMYSLSHHDMTIMAQYNVGVDLGNRHFSTYEMDTGILLHITDINAKDIEINYDTLTCYLSFDGVLRKCTIPLEAISHIIFEGVFLAMNAVKHSTKQYTPDERSHLKIIK